MNYVGPGIVNVIKTIIQKRTRGRLEAHGVRGGTYSMFRVGNYFVFQIVFASKEACG